MKICKDEDSCQNRLSLRHQNDSGGLEYGQRNRKILTTDLNMKEVYAKIAQKNHPVFSRKTNTNAQTHPVLTRSCCV
jgi:hypothetical protein